ncbi:MAG: ATP-dependent DNA helicase RecG [Patescibacteria group bacterium]|jgi:ATP-dependent DNA helicase RecG
MEKLDFQTKIIYLPSVGIKGAKKFERLGLFSISDLIYYFPRRYEDYTRISKISNIAAELADDWQNNNNFTVKGQILAIANKKTRRRGFTVTEAVVDDESASLKVVWFNQPYLAKMLHNGSFVILNGKVNFDRFSGGYAMESPVRVDRPRIAPIYSVTSGVTSFYIAKLINTILPIADEIEEYLPAEIIQKYDLLPIGETISNIHNPKDNISLAKAQARLAFDELFFISLQSAIAKAERSGEKSYKIETDLDELKSEIAKLPFELTGDQKKALWEIVKDLGNPHPMSRLLNGDVGSGKTIVAALAAWSVKQAGMKSLLMVPTEILANQHFETLTKLFGDGVGIFTSSKKMAKDTDWIIVGTQALIQKGVSFSDIGLVIVDEQHRFGVDQRAALQGKLEAKKEAMTPHFLSMTATPIPRTLHLALFGDLDLSIIREKPANRKEIKTRFVEPFNRDKAYEFIRAQIRAGRQAFVICPLIEEKEREIKENLFEEDRKSVISEFEKLKTIFSELEIAMLHGKLKAKEKDQIMSEFASGKTQLLVSTSVIEVGVDVPNATVMMIEDAERFGLAQIHQFRGRVGRAEHQSFCFLFSNSTSDKALTRLKALESTTDGFKLAEIDLETRGAGSIFGTSQSGLIDLRMASYSDYHLIQMASEAAKETVNKIKTLPKLAKKLDNFIYNKHLE